MPQPSLACSVRPAYPLHPVLGTLGRMLTSGTPDPNFMLKLPVALMGYVGVGCWGPGLELGRDLRLCIRMSQCHVQSVGAAL